MVEFAEGWVVGSGDVWGGIYKARIFVVIFVVFECCGLRVILRLEFLWVRVNVGCS